MLTTISAPEFGVGQVEGVREYVGEAVIDLCDRLDVDTDRTVAMLRLALASLDSAATVMHDSLNAGMVESTPAARRFWNAAGELFVTKDSKLHGADHLAVALEAQRGGANVLLIQNHRSGADTLVMETLVNRYFGNQVVPDWAYMAGHAVNLYLIPLMFTLAMRRFQIFSVKYRSAATNASAMSQQNRRAMMALRTWCGDGGKLLAFYPEGGRGETGLKAGEPQTICIPQIMRRSFKSGRLLIVPTYVHGAINILPVHRGENEYNEIFVHAQRGTATMTVGEPVSWDDLQPTTARADDEYRQVMIDQLMRRIAVLAPNDTERGHYAQ